MSDMPPPAVTPDPLHIDHPLWKALHDRIADLEVRIAGVMHDALVKRVEGE